MLGGPLLSQLKRRGSLTEEESASIADNLATAIEHLHSLGVAHRDIKPENVLCVSSESPCPVKLCDFDLCSAPELVDTFLLCDEDDLDDGEASLGYTKACDLWSLGVLLYILLSGQAPFQAPFTSTCSTTNCGWQEGASCSQCQRQLLLAITAGNLGFPRLAWASISSSAKHLVSCLLLRNSEDRLTASEVLAHPWVATGRNSRTSWVSQQSSWRILPSDSSSMR